MLGVRLRLRMAVSAGEDRVVVGIRVAVGADSVGVAMVHWEPGVIELSVRPLDGVVAGGASGREVRGCVIRIVRVQVVRFVAAVAVRRQVLVVVVDVAIRAGSRRHDVRTREREAGLAVIEVGIRPFDRVMAELAGLREPGGDVIRIVRVFVIGQVAGYARRVVQLVIVVYVAVGTGARRHGMRSRQSPSSL